VLTDLQRRELKALGPAAVRAKLFHPGRVRGPIVPGFASGPIDRADVECWLIEQAQPAEPTIA
jgi:hypothetical protein